MTTRHVEQEEWPLLIFWYGLSWRDLEEMKAYERELLARRLPGLIDAYQLILVNAALVPHLKPNDARRFISRLSRRRDTEGAARPQSVGELASMARASGIAFRRVARGRSSPQDQDERPVARGSDEQDNSDE